MTPVTNLQVRSRVRPTSGRPCGLGGVRANLRRDRFANFLSTGPLSKASGQHHEARRAAAISTPIEVVAKGAARVSPDLRLRPTACDVLVVDAGAVRRAAYLIHPAVTVAA